MRRLFSVSQPPTIGGPSLRMATNVTTTGTTTTKLSSQETFYSEMERLNLALRKNPINSAIVVERIRLMLDNGRPYQAASAAVGFHAGAKICNIKAISAAALTDVSLLALEATIQSDQFELVDQYAEIFAPNLSLQEHKAAVAEFKEQAKSGPAALSAKAAKCKVTCQIPSMATQQNMINALRRAFTPATRPRQLTGNRAPEVVIPAITQLIAQGHSKPLTPKLVIRETPEKGGYGLFATCDIRPGEVFWSEECYLAVHPDFKNNCHHCLKPCPTTPATSAILCPKCRDPSKQYCSEACRTKASLEYHAALCGFNTTYFEQAIANGRSGSSRYPMLLLRLLGKALTAADAAQSRVLLEPPGDLLPFGLLARAADSPLHRMHTTEGLLGPGPMLVDLNTNLSNSLFQRRMGLILDPSIGLEHVFQAHSAVYLNALSLCPDITCPTSDLLSDGAGLVIVGSFFNHSCTGMNVDYISDLKNHGARVNFQATKPVAPGEELFISYGSNPKLIKTQYGIDCNCSNCQLEKQ